MTENEESINEREDYFGFCPVCRSNDGYFNLGCNHWFVCHRHEVRWCWGANLTSFWRDEDEETWKTNWKLIGEYEVIEAACKK